jgi:Tfp pilus assembly protein PilV
MHPTPRVRRRSDETGVTLIEMMIAVLVLTIGLVALAQLFVVAALNNTYAVTTSGAVNDAQRLIESWKVKAAVNGISDPAITSALYNSGTDHSAAFAQLSGYYGTQPSRFRESVWVFDVAGNVVGTASPATPPGVAAGTLKSTGDNSRLIYVLMEPKIDDPRTIQPVILTAIVTGKPPTP